MNIQWSILVPRNTRGRAGILARDVFRDSGSEKAASQIKEVISPALFLSEH